MALSRVLMEIASQALADETLPAVARFSRIVRLAEAVNIKLAVRSAVCGEAFVRPPRTPARA